jgi:hypothetical protein
LSAHGPTRTHGAHQRVRHTVVVAVRGHVHTVVGARAYEQLDPVGEAVQVGVEPKVREVASAAAGTRDGLTEPTPLGVDDETVPHRDRVRVNVAAAHVVRVARARRPERTDRAADAHAGRELRVLAHLHAEPQRVGVREGGFEAGAGPQYGREGPVEDLLACVHLGPHGAAVLSLYVELERDVA